MKNLIYLLLILPFLAFANYIPLNLVGGHAPTVFSNSQDCQEFYKTSCILIPFGYNPAYHVLADQMIDDLDSPIKVCDGLDAIIDFLGLDANGCKITGYNQKASGEKIVVIDEAKKAAYDQAEAVKEAQRVALQKALKAMDNGRELIAKMAIRNVMKGLTPEQVAQFLATFKDVKEMLETGSLVTAKAAIEAIQPDGLATTQADKEFLLTEINTYLGK